MSMKIIRLCYNNVKRKKQQILLTIFFVLAFTTCFYIAIQQPRKTVIYIDDVNRTKGLSKTLFLMPNKVQDFTFAQSYQQETSSEEVEIFIDNIKKIANSSGLLKLEDSVLEANNIGYSAEELSPLAPFSGPFREENQKGQSENVNLSLQGFLNLHIWENVCHFQVESLREFILFPQAPSKRRLLTSSCKYDKKSNNFGERMFGSISPSTSGDYQFAISSSGNSELWLSSDESSANLRKIAFLGSRDNRGRGKPGNYSKVSTQVSTTFYLEKNMKYYMNVLHKHQSGKVHLEVAWRSASQAKFSVITGEYLWAEVNDSHVADNAVRLADYHEELQQSRDIVPPFVIWEDVEDVLPKYVYEPSYLVKHKLVRFQVSL